MSSTSSDSLPPLLREVIADVTPFFEQLDTGRFAVGLGGSRSKGMSVQLTVSRFLGTATMCEWSRLFLTYRNHSGTG
jgi:hypothetical protein